MDIPPNGRASATAVPPAVGDRAADRARPAGGVQDRPRAPSPGVFEELTGALSYARAAVSGFADIVTLEARRASMSLLWIVVCGLVAGICIVAAWLGLMVALAMAAIASGVPPIMATLATAAINV